MKKNEKQFREHELSEASFEVYSTSAYIFNEDLECYDSSFDKNNYVTRFDSIEEIEHFLLNQQ